MRMLESSIQCHFGRMIHSRGGISITWSKFSAHLGIPLEEGSTLCCSTWVYVESISIHQCRNTTFSISCDFASYINFISNTIVHHPSSMAASFSFLINFWGILNLSLVWPLLLQRLTLKHSGISLQLIQLQLLLLTFRNINQGLILFKSSCLYVLSIFWTQDLCC